MAWARLYSPELLQLPSYLTGLTSPLPQRQGLLLSEEGLVCACACVRACVCVYQETPFKYLLLTHPLSFQNSCCWVTVSHSLPFRAHLLITPQFLQSPPHPNNLGGHVHLLVPYTY